MLPFYRWGTKGLEYKGRRLTPEPSLFSSFLARELTRQSAGREAGRLAPVPAQSRRLWLTRSARTLYGMSLLALQSHLLSDLLPLPQRGAAHLAHCGGRAADREPPAVCRGTQDAQGSIPRTGFKDKPPIVCPGGGTRALQRQVSAEVTGGLVNHSALRDGGGRGGGAAFLLVKAAQRPQQLLVGAAGHTPTAAAASHRLRVADKKRPDPSPRPASLAASAQNAPPPPTPLPQPRGGRGNPTPGGAWEGRRGAQPALLQRPRPRGSAAPHPHAPTRTNPAAPHPPDGNPEAAPTPELGPQRPHAHPGWALTPTHAPSHPVQSGPGPRLPRTPPLPRPAAAPSVLPPHPPVAAAPDPRAARRGPLRRPLRHFPGRAAHRPRSHLLAARGPRRHSPSSRPARRA